MGCGNGSRFVIKPKPNTRRQLLFLEGKTILAFVSNGKKFADCSSYTEVTAMVGCKVIIDKIELEIYNLVNIAGTG